MRALALRRLCTQRQELQHRLRSWRAMGHQACLRTPPREGERLAFEARSASGRWQGLVNARHWLQAQLPQLLELLPEQRHVAAARAIFSALPRPFETAVADLEYEHLQIVSATHLDAGSLLSDWVRALPLNLQFSLGRTELSHAQWLHAAPGDVLVISHTCHRLYLLSRWVGHFLFDSEGLIMNVASGPQHGPLLEQSLHDAQLSLAFILHERPVTLQQLSEMMPGQVLPLDPSAATQVRVMAGRNVVAIGELVQLEDRLGVEILRLCRGPQDE
jgi:type III secretion protein Q